MPKTAKHHGVDTSPVTIGQVKYATVIAFLAWTFAVYDFILFGMLLPEIGKSLHLDGAGQARLATFVALGGVVVALCVGPVVDKFGRRFGMVFTVGGAGVASALTALAGRINPFMLVGIRSISGLGYAEQGVNGAYLSELYAACDNEKLAKRRGTVYSLVQGGWPIGALLASGLTAVLLPILGWQGCFVFAAIPSLIVALAATRLRESPQFEKIRAARHDPTAVEHAHTGHVGLRGILTGEARRTSLTLGGSHILNWFPVQVFSVLGTTVLVNVHGVSFSNSLVILLRPMSDRSASAMVAVASAFTRNPAFRFFSVTSLTLATYDACVGYSIVRREASNGSCDPINPQLRSPPACPPLFVPVLVAVGTACCDRRMPPSPLPNSSRATTQRGPAGAPPRPPRAPRPWPAAPSRPAGAAGGAAV